MRFLILFAVLMSSWAQAQSLNITERLSLKEVMIEMGYKPIDVLSVPLKKRDDVDSGLLGNFPQMNHETEHHWPFPEMAINSSLSTLALTLDPFAFQNGMPNAQSRVAIVVLPQNPDQKIQNYWTIGIPENMAAGELHFYDESLLRVERVEPKGKHNYLRSYSFHNVETGHSWNLSEDVKGVTNARHFSGDLYLVKKFFRYLVIRHNAIDRTYQTIGEIESDKIAEDFMHSPVDEPGRDVWRLSDDHTIIFNEISENGRFHRWALEVDGAKLSLGRAGEAHQEKIRQSQPSDSDYTYQEVRLGWVGQKAQHPNYEHRLFLSVGTDVNLLQERLIHTDNKNGAVVGLSKQDKDSGEIHLVRRVYDRKFSELNTSKSEVASELCHRLLESYFFSDKRTGQ